jgi:hypothetical protein
MTDISKQSPADKSARFAALCWARARLFAEDVYTLHQAVDELQAWAMTNGLVTDIGQDAVQKIRADAFYAVRPELWP